MGLEPTCVSFSSFSPLLVSLPQLSSGLGGRWLWSSEGEMEVTLTGLAPHAAAEGRRRVGAYLLAPNNLCKIPGLSLLWRQKPKQNFSERAWLWASRFLIFIYFYFYFL